MRLLVTGKQGWGGLSLAAGIWICFLIPLGLLFATADCSLEMTDEGSYLLIAQNPWLTRGHGTLFGFALHPLWLLAGQHLASFRMLGFVMGVVVGLVFARSLELRLASTAPLRGWVRAGLYGGLLVASLGIYVDGIRTLCYNWLAWCGGALLLAAMLSPVHRGWRGWGWTAAGALGWLVLLLGKWGAALALGAWMAGVLLLRRNRTDDFYGERNRLAAILGLGTGMAAVAAWAIGLPGLADTLHAGVLISRETGSHGFWLIQKYGWEIFYYLYRLGRAFVWIIPLGWLVWWVWKKVAGKPPEIPRFAPWMFLLGAGLALVRGYGVGGTLAFSKESIIAGAWWLGVLWATSKTTGLSLPGPVPWRYILLLTTAPFVLGVGTNTSLADYAGHSTLYTLAAGWLLAQRLLGRMSAGGWLAMVLSVAVLQSTRMVTSLQHSYRVGSLWEQVAGLETGPEKGRLKVRPEFADFLNRLDAELRQAGFSTGSPVVGISDLCGVVYLAGGTSPGVPWFFGQVAGQKPYTQAVLAWLPPEELSRVWVFRSQATRLPGDVASFWPPHSPVAVPRRVAVVPGLPAESGEAVMEIYRPSP